MSALSFAEGGEDDVGITLVISPHMRLQLVPLLYRVRWESIKPTGLVVQGHRKPKRHLPRPGAGRAGREGGLRSVILALGRIDHMVKRREQVGPFHVGAAMIETGPHHCLSRVARHLPSEVAILAYLPRPGAGRAG